MILITGHKGFIGSRLMVALRPIKDIVDILGIDIKDGNNLLDCPLYDPEDVEVIYHLAAQSSVEKSWNDPLMDSYNFNMTVRLVDMYPNAKLVYANSCASLKPKSPYGFSKKVAGDYIKAFHKNYVNLIFPNIYGRGSQSVVDVFKRRDKVTVFGDGLQVRDYVHVNDIVRGLIEAEHWKCGEYFMGSGIGTTVLDLAGDKDIIFAPARKEEREVVVPNTTPSWKPSMKVLDYIK